MAEAFRPNPAGTFLAEGKERWAPWNVDKVQWEGDVDAVFATQTVELVASGFRWTEGPTWVESNRSLLFSDTIDARIYKWSEADGSVAPFVEVSGGYDGENVEDYEKLFEPGSNGMTLVGDDLYVCQHPTHRIVKLKLSDIKPSTRFCENTFEVLADSLSDGGARLNSPNDLVVGPDGAVWFTDPIYGFLLKDPTDPFVPVCPPPDSVLEGCHNPSDLPYLDEQGRKAAGKTGVYRWNAGVLDLVVDNLDRPNGLAFDGETLWVANSNALEASWTAYDASIILGSTEPIAEPLAPKLKLSEKELGPMPGPGLSDGFRIDGKKRIWSSCPSGVVVIDTVQCRVVAKVLFHTNISNIQFGAGGDVWVTGLGHIWRLQRKLDDE